MFTKLEMINCIIERRDYIPSFQKPGVYSTRSPYYSPERERNGLMRNYSKDVVWEMIQAMAGDFDR